MAVKITYFKTEEFYQLGVFNQHRTECKLNELVFIKGDTLGHHEIKQVLDTCNKYNSFDINTLIIKGEDDLTVWIEEKSKRSTSQNNQNSQVVSQPVENKQSIPTKTVTKRYRGQVYQEEVVDWEAMQQMDQQEKPRRKYRGQYID